MNGRRCVGNPSESAPVTSYSGEDQTCPVNMMKNAHKSKCFLVAAGSLLLMVHQRFHCLQRTAPNLIKQKWRLCFFLPSALPLRLNICCLCCFSLKTWGKVLSDEVSAQALPASQKILSHSLFESCFCMTSSPTHPLLFCFKGAAN